MIKVGDKQKPYEVWQAGNSLAASPLVNSLAGFAKEYGGSAARQLPNPASYAGYRYHSYLNSLRVFLYNLTRFNVLSWDSFGCGNDIVVPLIETIKG